MPPPFMAAERRFIALTARLRSGALDEEGFNKKIQEMAFKYKDGAYWTIGGKDARWYRYDGQQWIPQDPPITPRPEETSKTISSQGTESITSVPASTIVPKYSTEYPEGQAPVVGKKAGAENKPVARNVRWLLIGCAASAALLLVCLVMFLVLRIIYSQLPF